MPEQIANALKPGSGEGIRPGMRLLVLRCGVNLGGDPKEARSFGRAVRYADVLGQREFQKAAGVQLTFGNDRGEASADFENASLGTLGEIAAPQVRRDDEIESAGSAVRLTMTESHDRPIDDDILSGGRQGWPAILSSLKSLLESGHALDIPLTCL